MSLVPQNIGFKVQLAIVAVTILMQPKNIRNRWTMMNIGGAILLRKVINTVNTYQNCAWNCQPHGYLLHQKVSSLESHLLWGKFPLGASTCFNQGGLAAFRNPAIAARTPFRLQTPWSAGSSLDQFPATLCQPPGVWVFYPIELGWTWYFWANQRFFLNHLNLTNQPKISTASRHQFSPSFTRTFLMIENWNL
jgi:hypothetical protein